MQGAAHSTVAMTAYNAMTIAIAPADVATLQSLATKLNAHPEQVKVLEKGLELLVKRGLARSDGGEYDLIDPLRRPVIARDRTDPEGWKGWLVRDASGKHYLLADIVKGSG